MKTKEELNALKEEVETVSRKQAGWQNTRGKCKMDNDKQKMQELSDAELEYTSGGYYMPPSGLTPKYKRGEIVESTFGWKLEVITYVGYNEERGFTYDTYIVELPSTYQGAYQVHGHYIISECNLK